jgi:hypothetical protein
VQNPEGQDQAMRHPAFLDRRKNRGNAEARGMSHAAGLGVGVADASQARSKLWCTANSATITEAR